MDIIHAEKAMKNSFNKRLFRQLWEENANEYDFYSFALKIDSNITWEDFDYGWQYRIVLAQNFKDAIQEFTQILFGAI
jgi:hypothetical protein